MAKKGGYYPVVRKTTLDAATSGFTAKLLRVDRELSKLNRRLYRESRCYRVKIDAPQGFENNYNVFALRNSWDLKKALQLAKSSYDANVSQEKAHLTGNQMARWQDFRTNTGLEGSSDELRSELWPIGFVAGAAQTAGQFVTTSVVDGSGSTREFTWGTPSGAEFGILHEFQKAGRAQSAPEDLSLGAYNDLDTTVDGGILLDLQTDGNAPPYAEESDNTNPFVYVGTIGAVASGQQRHSTGFFDAPCGIVVITTATPGAINSTLSFEVQAGDYKGVNAPSMLE